MDVMDSDVSLAEFELLERASSDEVSVELINGRIYVAPAPDGDHDEFAVSIREQFREQYPDRLFYHERGLRLPAYREGRARVDGVLVPQGYFRNEPSWADPSGVELILEITSGRDRDADVDRIEKRDAYAQAGIPVYLLVDRHRREVSVFSAPIDGEYTQHSIAKFGASLALPKPFDFGLDTTELL